MKKLFQSGDQMDANAVDVFIEKAKEAGIESTKEDDPNDDLNFWNLVCNLVYCDKEPVPTPQDGSEAGTDRHDDPEYREDWADSAPNLSD